MEAMKTAVVIFTFWVTASATHHSYEGYKVFELYPSNSSQFAALQNLENENVFDFWTRTASLPITIMIGPDHVNYVKSRVEVAEIRYNTVNYDLEREIAHERIVHARMPPLEKGYISFDRYHRYQAMQDYISRLAKKYPDIITVEVAGESYEKLPIQMVKIGSGDKTNPIILIDGGIHAREWISPAVMLYFIQELVENRDNRHMIEDINWFIIPVLNPDGYEYTHTKERLWRKTRSYTGSFMCPGVDANRNFDFHWRGLGGSRYKCAETYAGKSPFSESESRALRDVVYKYKKQLKLYITFHSFGKFILHPWSHTLLPPKDVKELRALGENVAKAIESVSGTKYEVGPSMKVLFPVGAASGSTFDWVKGVAGIQLSYAVELPGPGPGSGGFILPPSQIMNVTVETFEGLKVYYQYVKQKFKVT